MGGVLGIGLALEAEVDFTKPLTIAQSWVICPVLVLLLAFLLYKAISIAFG